MLAYTVRDILPGELIVYERPILVFPDSSLDPGTKLASEMTKEDRDKMMELSSDCEEEGGDRIRGNGREF